MEQCSNRAKSSESDDQIQMSCSSLKSPSSRLPEQRYQRKKLDSVI